MDPLTVMAVGYGAQALGSYISNRSKAKDEKRLADQQNRFRDSQIQQYTQGTQAGAREMQDAFNARIEQQQQNPMSQAFQTQDFNTLANASGYRSAVDKAYSGFDSGQQGQVHSYTPQQVAAQQAQATLAQAVSSGRGMQQAQLGDRDAVTLQQQAELRDRLGAAARGETPSLANQAMLSGMERAAQQQAGLAAQARGGAGSLLAQRQAQRMGNQAMLGASREGAMMSLDERERAQSMFGSQLGAMRAESTQRDIQQAAFQQQAEQANLQKRLQDAGLATNINAANAAALTGMSQFNVSNANQMALANQQAINAQRAAEAQNRTGMSQFNVSRADDLARLRSGLTMSAADRELGMRADTDRFNVMQQTAAQSENNRWLQDLQRGALGAQERGAFVGADAAQLGLNQGQALSRAAPSFGGQMLQSLGQGAMSAGTHMYTSGLSAPSALSAPNTTTNHMTNPYMNRSLEGLQNILR